MTDPAHPHLDAAIEDRRLELGLRKQDVAARANVTPTHLRRVLKGEVPLSVDLEAGLERALEWPRGHIARLAPESVDDLASPPPGSPYTPAQWALLDTVDRRALAVIHRKLAAKRGNSALPPKRADAG